MENRRVVLASRPQDAVSEDNFRIESAPLPRCGDGEVLVRNLWISLDPYMRGRMRDAKSYAKGVDIGEVMVGQTVGEVVESRHPGSRPGEKVLTQLGWQLYGCAKEVSKIDGSRAPLTCYLGVLGMPGMTAYLGLKEVGSSKPCETLVVSAAWGEGGRVGGMSADYSATQPYAVRNLRFVLINRIRMQGMIVFDWKERYGEALKALGEYFAQGKLKYRESIVEGLENAPKGLIALLRGQN